MKCISTSLHGRRKVPWIGTTWTWLGCRASSAGRYTLVVCYTLQHTCILYFHLPSKHDGNIEWVDFLPDTCVFCSESLGPKSSFRRLLCGHFFHLPCIDSWICGQDASCPICRRTFYHLRRQRHVVASPPSRPSDVSRSRTSSSSNESSHHRWERVLAFVKQWVRERDSWMGIAALSEND